MLRSAQPLALILLAMTAACSDDPTASASVARPAGARCTTSIVITAAAPLTMHITGVCNRQHLGRTTVVIDQTVDGTGVITGTVTYAAANGDLLNSTFNGYVTSPPGPNVAFRGTETYTGGTGRFAEAFGSSELEGRATVNYATGTGTGEYTTTGSISY